MIVNCVNVLRKTPKSFEDVFGAINFFKEIELITGILGPKMVRNRSAI